MLTGREERERVSTRESEHQRVTETKCQRQSTYPYQRERESTNSSSGPSPERQARRQSYPKLSPAIDLFLPRAPELGRLAIPPFPHPQRPPRRARVYCLVGFCVVFPMSRRASLAEEITREQNDYESPKGGASDGPPIYTEIVLR